ncbi:TraC family protein, partial [Myxococcota bacterium]
MPELKLFQASTAWEIVDDTLICFDLSFTQGLRLVGIDTTCLTDAVLDELSRALNEALCSIPDGVILRFHSVETASNSDFLAAYRNQFEAHEIGAYVARKKVEQCRSQLSPRRREVYCFVTTPPETSFTAYNPSVLGRSERKLCARAKQLHVRKTQDVLRLRKSVARVLSSAGISSEPLNAQHLFEVLWCMANPLLAARVGPPIHHPDASLRFQLFHGGLLNHFDKFEREDAINRVLTLKLPPKQVVPTQIRELQYLPFTHHLCVV